VHSLGRRSPPDQSAKLNAHIEKESAKWGETITSLSPSPAIFFSSLGTTRAAAGGLENQRKIDLDLNLDAAKAARKAGAKVYVLISSTGAHSGSMFPYPKMKGELEDAVQTLGYDSVVILRPGMIVGDRQESRLAEGVLRNIAKGLGAISQKWLKDAWAQDATVIAKAAIHAGELALEGKVKDKVWIVGQSDIVRLGRTEWVDAQ
jgi:nucleoside-diphosphate-sugar epimerase